MRFMRLVFNQMNPDIFGAKFLPSSWKTSLSLFPEKIKNKNPFAAQEVMHFTFPAAATAVCFEYIEEKKNCSWQEQL